MSANTLQTLNGLFKELYASQIENLIPENVKLMKMIDFIEKSKQPK